MVQRSPLTSGDSAGDKLGLPAAIALVVGGIIGTGIFTLPAEMAPYGRATYVAFAVVAIGSLLVALAFADITRRLPRSGGPYLYAREAFGDFTGFLAAWCYWIGGWTGQATLAVACAGYIVALFGLGRSEALLMASLFSLWLPVVVNLTGTRTVGAVQVATTVLKLVPLLAVGIIGTLRFDSANLGISTAADSGWMAAFGPACAALLFSFVGMEGAAVVAERVRDPERTVPRAITLGMAICAAVYLLGLLGVQGTVPQATLAKSTAPFADAAKAITGAQWAATLVALAAVISALGALNAWTLINAEMVAAAARDGIFPKWAHDASRDVPLRAILLNSLLSSVLIATNFSGSFIGLYLTLALLSSFTSVFTYVLSVAAQLSWLVTGHRRPFSRHVVLDMLKIALGLGFCIWMCAATGAQAVYAGTILLILGIPVYVFAQASHKDAA